MDHSNDQLVRFLVRHWLVGAGATVVIVATLFAADIGGLRGLVMSTQHPVLPVAMLFCGFLVTLTSASMGAALMSLGDDRAPKGPRGRGLFAQPELIPIPVRARRRP
ncbi:hypothetical protein [Amorphus sp. MBR-141]